MKASIYGLTLEQLSAWLVEKGQQKFRAKQIWDWLYKKKVTRFRDMHNLNKQCVQLLNEHFVIRSMQVQLKQESVDGTVKFLLKLYDGHVIETVLMRQSYGLSVCVTTQVGCNIGCSFCASGLLKKTRDLESGEIVEQIMTVQHYLDSLDDQLEQAGDKRAPQQAQDQAQDHGQSQSKRSGGRVSHVVVMGIGEPFDNFEALMQFLRIINAEEGLNIGARHITVSTSGLVDKIYEFADAQLQVNLAISLHAPNDELRTRIMKINRAIPIAKLMQAVDYYVEKTNRRVTFEYIMLKDVNDREQEARELAGLLGHIRHLAYVNLIPYNPVDEHSQYARSERASVHAFYETLKRFGIQCGIRKEHGTDIDAACGQLRSKQI